MKGSQDGIEISLTIHALVTLTPRICSKKWPRRRSGKYSSLRELLRLQSIWLPAFVLQAVLGDVVFNRVRTTFQEENVNLNIFKALLVLIPKEEVPVKITQFKPISFRNMVYKIITKVLVNHTRPILDIVISMLKSNFIPGRSMDDNILVAQEMVHSIIKKKQE